MSSRFSLRAIEPSSEIECTVVVVVYKNAAEGSCCFLG